MRLRLYNYFLRLRGKYKTENIFKPMFEVAGNQTDLKIQKLLIDSAHFIRKLYQQIGAKFIVTENNELIIEIDDIKIFIDCAEDLFIVNEVFNELTYNIKYDKPLVVIDVGMNIGTSTLFFLKNSNVKKIYGFEPVEFTFNKLIKNLEINNQLGNIEIENYGLGESDKIVEFEFSEDFKGSVGINGLSETKKNKSKYLRKVSVQLKDAYQEILNIINQSSGTDILLKIDCEGGEYEILSRLSETGVLNRIKIIMLEWHGKKFIEDLNCLDKFSFFCFKNSSDTGMIYAIRNDAK